MIFIFYHNDNDGKCAAQIVSKKYSHHCTCVPVDYNMDFPFSMITPVDDVFIVDFSLQKDGDWEKLLEIADNVTWIDHHKTAIEKQGKQRDLKGIRSTSASGCELTWKYFYPTDPMPNYVELIGDWDTWTFKYGDKTREFNSGLKAKDLRPGDFPDWLDLLYKPDDVVAAGRSILHLENIQNASYLKAFGFETEFEGHMAYACNKGMTGSPLFDSLVKSFPLLMPFVFNGTVFTISLYTTDPHIDVSKIAKKYGGGGHKGAAGFQSRALPFTKKEEGKR